MTQGTASRNVTSFESPPGDQTVKPKTILIVDDDANNRALLEAELQLDGHQTVSASDGEAGVSRALTLLPDLILMDLAMPRLDGFGAIEQLRQHNSTSLIPIIIMSGMVEVSHRVRGLKLGANDYICKPFDPQDMKARVRTHLKLQSLERVRQQQQRDQVALEVLGAAAHELSQPISGALGQVQLLLMLAGGNQEDKPLDLSRERFKQIEQCLQRAEGVLHKLSDLEQYKCLDYAGGVKILDIYTDEKRSDADE